MNKPITGLRGLAAAAILTLIPASASAQFADGLIAYWPFDDDLRDSTDTAAHGTFVEGSGDPELRFAPGQFENGINLNDFAAGAFDQYVTIADIDEGTFDFAGGNMTVSLWASTPFLSIDNQTIIAKGEGGSWSLSRDGGNSSPAFTAGGSAAVGDPLLHFLDDTLMHHVVGVVEAGVGVRVYLDGQLVGSINGDIQLGDAMNSLAIGANPDAEADLFRPWEGVIDDVAIWDRALSAGDVALLYNNGTGVSIADVINPVDTDEDGMPDFYENSNGLDPNVNDAASDLDEDGLTNLQEFEGGTNPQLADTDEDGLTDGDELNVHSTDPVNADSDADGLSDGQEISGSHNPFLEGALRDPFDPEVDPAGDPTDPNAADSDDDTFEDQTEIEFNSDPNDANSSPSPWQIGLKGYWPLDKASYDAQGDDNFPDASGRGFDGMLAGTATSPQWFGSPFYPAVLRLDGTDQRVEIGGDNPDEFAMAGGNLTVSAWFLTPAWGKSWQAIVAKGEGNNWRVHRNGGNSNLAFAGGRADISGGGNYADFKWHNVVAQSEFDVGTKLFIDGELVVQGDGSNLSANGQPMMIGGNPDTAGDNFRTLFGAVCEVAVWDRLLTLSEIRTIWSNYDGASGGATVADLILGIDTDEDGMTDIYEDNNGFDKNDPSDGPADPDEDGLTNAEEFRIGTDPHNADTDDDGLNDKEESEEGTDPFNADSDSDGVSDGEEVYSGSNGSITDPLDEDSDNDGFKDGVEIAAGTDPNDAGSQPGIEADLVAYFPLDGNLVDENPLAPGAHDATFQGGTADYVDSQFGQGLNLNGSSHYATIGGDESDVEFVGANMTLSVWASIPNVSRSWQCLVGKGEGNSWRLHTWGNRNQMTFTGGNGDIQGGDFTENVGIADGEMHHILVTVEHGVRSRIYFDGELVGTRTNPAPNLVSQNNNPARIGDNAGATGRFWQGRVDDLAIWGRALEPKEIAAIWESGKSIGTLIEDGIDGGGGEDPVVLVTNADFNGDNFELVVEGLIAERNYVLRRSADGENFEDVADSTFTGGVTHTFVDPAPPANTQLYQIWEVAP